ncbi:hypothetical protein ES332_D13G066200v1 [Gossypium tomentosum]|uniref:Uncharacterized protein n=1 Tax=Gossypium tomentosum TaxID=34277 RepID=A0A5D2HTI4_GOSTO|nr:hypothetical protein ES332_D13G066200v1 [Gossypium tomentosum]
MGTDAIEAGETPFDSYPSSFECSAAVEIRLRHLTVLELTGAFSTSGDKAVQCSKKVSLCWKQDIQTTKQFTVVQ